MDGLNPEIMEMMDELQGYMGSQDNAGKPEADQYGMPFEPDDSFSLAPLGFLETAMRMEVQMMELFRMAYKLNRHSPQYIRVSGQLEKTVAQMGRYCITKAVLEQQGCCFGYLEDLTIDRLRKITGFNYRKTWSAFMEDCVRNDYNGNVPDLSIRWADLDARLKATQEKIDKIRTGEVRVDVKTKSTVSAVPDNSFPDGKTEEQEKDPAPFAPQGRALPVDKAAVREFEKQQEAQQPADAADPFQEVSPETPDETSETPAEDSERKEADVTDLYLIEDASGEDDPDDDEWDDPYVSDELIQRMADYWQRQAMVLPVMEAPP